MNSVFRLAACRRMMGQLCLYTGKLAASERHFRQAVERVESWADGSRHQPAEVRLGSCHHDLAEVLTLTERLDEAEAARRKSIAACEWDHSATAAMFPHNKSLAHYRLGELLHHTGRTVEATNEFTRALAIMEDLSRPARQLGQRERALERYTEAQEAIEAGDPYSSDSSA